MSFSLDVLLLPQIQQVQKWTNLIHQKSLSCWHPTSADIPPFSQSQRIQILKSCLILSLSKSSFECFFQLFLHSNSHWYYFALGHPLLQDNCREFFIGLSAFFFSQPRSILNITNIIPTQKSSVASHCKSSKSQLLCLLFKVLHNLALICLLCLNTSIETFHFCKTPRTWLPNFYHYFSFYMEWVFSLLSKSYVSFKAQLKLWALRL